MADRFGRWDLLDHPSDPVDVDTAAIGEQLAHFRSLAEMLRVEGQRLSRIGSGEALRGEYADEMRSAAGEVGKDLNQAVGRYDAVVRALVEFQPAVDAALSGSAAALDDAMDATGAQINAAAMVLATAMPGIELTPEQLQGNDDKQAATDAAAGRLQAAKEKLSGVLAEFDRAGQQAAATVRGGFEDGLTDSGWDRFKYAFAKFLKILVEVLAIIGMVLAAIAVLIPGIGPILAAGLLTAASIIEGVVFVSEVALVAMGEGSWLDIGLAIASFFTFGAAKGLGVIIKRARRAMPPPRDVPPPASRSNTPPPASRGGTPPPASRSNTPPPASRGNTPPPRPDTPPPPRPDTPPPARPDTPPPPRPDTPPPPAKTPPPAERPKTPPAEHAETPPPPKKREEWPGQLAGRPEPGWRKRERLKKKAAGREEEERRAAAEAAELAEIKRLDEADAAEAAKKGYRMEQYTGGGYTELNRYLRDRAAGKVGEDPEIEKKIADLDTHMKEAPVPSGPVTTYRGVEGDFGAGLHKGDIYSDPAYMSTSADKSVADGFIGKQGREGTRFTLDTDGRGRDVSEFSAQRELEVLFERGEKFEVVSVEKIPGAVQVPGTSRTVDIWDVHLRPAGEHAGASGSGRR